jgi:hypothetical protein
MIASGEDALNLLRKWFEERTPVKAFFVPADSLAEVVVSGFVNALSKEGGILISDGSVPEKDVPKHYIWIDPTHAREFDYGEAKDVAGVPEEVRHYLAEAHGVASLSIRFEGGSRLSIFERRQDT